MSQVVNVLQVHDEDAARAIITAAWGIAWSTDYPDEHRIAVFNKAVDLLGARIPIPPTPPVPLSIPSLGIRG